MEHASSSVVRLPRERLFSALELHAVAIGTVAAVVLMVGWGFGVTLFQTLFPGFPPMRPGASFAFMLLSLSCLLSLRPSLRSQVMSSVSAGAALLWVASLAVRNWGVELDGVTFQTPIQATLASLILGAIAMLIINLAPRYGVVAGAIAISAATPALYRVLSLLLFWGAPHEEDSLFSSMALHTAILIVWFMACILMHPRLSFANAIFQRSIRGRVLRQALPFIVALPVVVGAVCLILVQALDWNTEVLFALTAVISVALGAALIWWLSRLLAEWQVEANERANRLARANEALDQYASSAAHDLRAPARHVMIFGELMQEAIRRGDMDAAGNHAAKMQASAAQLPPIIDGMLEYARSGFTEVTPGRHALSELVQSASVLLEEDLKAARAQVSVAQDPELWCDGQLIATVFQNLLANSIANRRRGRPLEIVVEAALADGEWTITVSDNGSGFDPDFATVAFNPLARGAKQAGAGAGIGLATCRTIIASHNGRIRVDPAAQGGARIEFTLPAAAAGTD